MGDPRRECGIRDGCEQETWISESYSRILTSCFYAGLPPSEADDLAQDIWLWLLRQSTPALVVSMPWLTGVARNFILRYRRRSFRRKTREGRPLDAAPEPRTAEALPEIEASELLDRVAAAAPEIERRLLALIRSGHSLAEAARILKIPRGSRAYYHQRDSSPAGGGSCGQEPPGRRAPGSGSRTRRGRCLIGPWASSPLVFCRPASPGAPERR